jgi:hypothetical protein
MIKESGTALTQSNFRARGAEPKKSFSQRDSRGLASEQSSDGSNSAGKRRGPVAVDCCPGPLDDRGASLSPRVTGAATGLLVGLVTTSAQEIYCPILDAAHILTWHLGIAVLGASIGLAAGWAGETDGRRLKRAQC